MYNYLKAYKLDDALLLLLDTGAVVRIAIMQTKFLEISTRFSYGEKTEASDGCLVVVVCTLMG